MEQTNTITRRLIGGILDENAVMRGFSRALKIDMRIGLPQHGNPTRVWDKEKQQTVVVTPRLVLSMSGSYGGERYGGGGQCYDLLRAPETMPPDGVAREQMLRLADLWERWANNGSQGGCAHQRATGNARKVLTVVEYHLTIEATKERNIRIHDAARAVALGHEYPMTERERALVLLAEWFKPRHSLPPEGDPLRGCFEERKRETRIAAMTFQHEHPEGLLGKACEECGYKYGSAWLHEDLPVEVIEELKAWPAEVS